MLPLLFGMALVLGMCEPQFFGLWEGLVWAKFSSYWAVRQIFIYLIAGCTYFGSIEPFLDLQIQLDFSHRVGSGREAWAQHITNWRTVTTPLGLVASYCSSYHHISICMSSWCILHYGSIFWSSAFVCAHDCHVHFTEGGSFWGSMRVLRLYLVPEDSFSWYSYE